MPRCPNPRCSTDYPPGTFKCVKPNCQCLLPEAVIAGRYRIETLLGLGGMGAVYRASDTFEMQQVALKVIQTASRNMDEATAVERFRREARYAHQLKHKNIVPVLNFGQDGSLLYLVMPLVTGGTLKDLLKAEKPLALPLALRYLRDLAEAIDAIHEHPLRVVHRDIKPSNLLIHQDDGRLVIADFGIARAMQKERPLTQSGWALGSEHYTAPEQGQGKAEPASDIYSLGVVAYQILTGLLPFQAIVRSRAAKLPCPSELNRELPTAVDDVVFRAIDNDPLKRYRTAREFVDALDAAVQLQASSSAEPTRIEGVNNVNVLVRALIPENPCSVCGQENRSTSRFCRRCGHRLDDTSPLVTDVCQVGYVSDTGRKYVAETNEDMLLIVQGLCTNLAPPPRPFGLFAVADGLRDQQGKSAGGYEASRLAIETITDVLLPLLATPLPSTTYTPAGGHRSHISRSFVGRKPPSLPESMLEQWMRESVRRAGQVIYHCNADYETSMASTVTMALVYKHRAHVVSIGDCRAYHYRPGGALQCLTSDHTLAANLVQANLLRPDEIYGNTKNKQLYRFLGQSNQVQVDYFVQEVEVNDLILLCTNGLWHMLRDTRLQELLARDGDPQKLARVLVDEANLAGGEGNVSVILVRVQ
ncbi:MAG TPA: protein kinase [Ktedonobacteraceae bacterium]|nr:protein kinase [Ktedonobacteraceae bacterium]